jgi:hypothetical protein
MFSLILDLELEKLFFRFEKLYLLLYYIPTRAVLTVASAVPAVL